MRIKSCSTHHTLYRYGGTVDGKSTTVKIGEVPVDATRDAIPAEIVEELGPRDMRTLIAFLDAKGFETARSELAAFSARAEAVIGLITPEHLDQMTAARLLAASARIKSKVRRVTAASKQFEFAPPLGLGKLVGKKED